MSHPHIILATESRFANASAADASHQGPTEDDKRLAEALARRGAGVAIEDWADNAVSWQKAHCAVVRSTWDYCERIDEFVAWIDRMSQETLLINSPETLKWNVEKRYLLDLEQRGVHIVPTRIVERGSSQSLQQLVSECGWSRAVLKPVVGGTARHTYSLAASNLVAHESTFRELIMNEAMLLQPFQDSVPTEGELSLIVIDGQVTHATLKKAKKGDFRVQSDFGGSVACYAPTRAERMLAEAVVACCEPTPVYARVDVVRDNAGQLALMELELVQPELFLRLHPTAADTFADAILKRSQP